MSWPPDQQKQQHRPSAERGKGQARREVGGRAEPTTTTTAIHLHCPLQAMPNTPPMNVSLSKLRLFERDYTHRKSCGFGCLPRLIEKHRFIFIVDSNHRADEWGPPFPRQVLHPTSICVVNPAPVDTTQRKKPTHPSINLEGMATQNESTCRLHHYLH